MTVSATPRRAGSYTGNGTNTQFPFVFKVFAKTDVQVVLTDDAGQETVLTQDSHYSVVLNPDQENAPGGIVTYPVAGAPLAQDQLLNILSVVPYEQPTDIQNQGGFYPQVIEDAFDRNTIQIQQLAEGLSRAILLPVSDTRTAEEFIKEILNAVKLLGNFGKLTVSTDPPSGGKNGDIWFQVL